MTSNNQILHNRDGIKVDDTGVTFYHETVISDQKGQPVDFVNYNIHFEWNQMNALKLILAERVEGTDIHYLTRGEIKALKSFAQTLHPLINQ